MPRTPTGQAATNSSKSKCVLGHPLSGGNLFINKRGARVCRECNRRRKREWKSRNPVTAKPRGPVAITPTIERVLAKLDKTGECWEWTGARVNGYGVVQRGRRGEGVTRVHRVAYAHFHGPIPEGLDVMHACHNRVCVNPDHLSVGTRRENMAQSKAAGRLKRKRRH